MTPDCAKELVDLIMLDEFVERRKALDVWVRRWCGLLDVQHDFQVPGIAPRMVLIQKIAHALLVDEVSATYCYEQEGVRHMQLHLLLQKPFDPKEHHGKETVSG